MVSYHYFSSENHFFTCKTWPATLPVAVTIQNHRNSAEPSVPVRKHKTHLEKVKQGNYVAYTTLSASMMR